MKKPEFLAPLQILLASLLLLVCLSSCSWMTSFVIANLSDEEVGITYSYEKGKNNSTGLEQCLDLRNPDELAIQTLAESDNTSITNWRNLASAAEWTQLQEDEFSYDRHKCVVQVSLPAHTALRVGRSVNYTGHAGNAETLLGIKSITLNSPDDLLTFEGPGMVRKFEKLSTGLYIFYYRDPLEER